MMDIWYCLVIDITRLKVAIPYKIVVTDPRRFNKGINRK